MPIASVGRWVQSVKRKKTLSCEDNDQKLIAENQIFIWMLVRIVGLSLSIDLVNIYKNAKKWEK